MGQELECNMQYQGRTLAGKAYLETDYVLFRGGERVKIPLKDVKGVGAAGGLLKLAFAGGPAIFDLGAAAEEWALKILHPPSLLEKLGVKSGLVIGVEGELEPEFLRQIGALAGPKVKADLLFLAAQTAGDLSRLRELMARLKPKGALWIVYPKGGGTIRESEVLDAGRAAGLKDVKVARFSATHTALRFVGSR